LKIPTALSSAPRERVELFRHLIEHDGRLDTEEFMKYAHVSRATALKEMEKMHVLGLADKESINSVTKPLNTIKLRDEFDWFLSEEFHVYWKQFQDSLTSSNSKLSPKPKENLEKNKVGMDEFLGNNIPASELPSPKIESFEKKKGALDDLL